jgi:hypothetical protein
MTDDSAWKRNFGKPGWKRYLLFGATALTTSVAAGAGGSKALFGSAETPGQKGVEVAAGAANAKNWLPLWMDYIRVPGSIDEAVLFIKELPTFLPTPQELEHAVQTLEKTAAALAKAAPTVQNAESKLRTVSDAAAQISETAERIKRFRILTNNASEQLKAGHPIDASRTLEQAFAILPTIPLPSTETLKQFAAVAQEIAHNDSTLTDIQSNLERTGKLMQEMNKVIIPIGPRFAQLEKSPEYKALLNLVDNLQPDELKYTLTYFALCFLIGTIGSSIIVLIGHQARPTWIQSRITYYKQRPFLRSIQANPEQYVSPTVYSAIWAKFVQQYESGTLTPEELKRLPPAVQAAYVEHVQRLKAESETKTHENRE